MNIITDTIRSYLPEVSLLLFIIISLLLSFVSKKHWYRAARGTGILGISITFCSLLFTAGSSSFTIFLKTLILISSFFVILISDDLLRKHKDSAFRFITYILLGIFCSFYILSTNSFLILFLAFLAFNLVCFRLMIFDKEALDTAKNYLKISGIAVLLIFAGAVYVFWGYRTLNYDNIAYFLTNIFPTLGFNAALMAIISGLLFIVSAVPFSSLIPDFFEKSNYPCSILFSTIGTIAGMGAILRLFANFGMYCPLTKLALTIFAALTLFIGAFGLMKQICMTRFLAYSSIIHAGFMLICICSLYLSNISAILFYLTCYIFMNIGVWSAVCLFRRSNKSDEIASYRGLYFKRPFYVCAFSICLFALAGMPITSGFLAKLYLFMAMAKSGLIYLLFLILTMALSLIAVYAYLKVIRNFYQNNEKLCKLDNRYSVMKHVLYFSTIVTVVLCFLASPLIELCKIIAYSI